MTGSVCGVGTGMSGGGTYGWEHRLCLRRLDDLFSAAAGEAAAP